MDHNPMTPLIKLIDLDGDFLFIDPTEVQAIQVMDVDGKKCVGVHLRGFTVPFTVKGAIETVAQHINEEIME